MNANYSIPFIPFNSRNGRRRFFNLCKAVAVLFTVLVAAACLSPRAYHATLEIRSRPDHEGYSIGIREADAVVVLRSTAGSHSPSIITVYVSPADASEIRALLEQLAGFSIVSGAQQGSITMVVDVVDGSKHKAQHYFQLPILPSPAQNILTIINSYLPPEEQLH